MRIAFVVQARDARHLSEVGGRSTQVVALQAQRLLQCPQKFGAKMIEVQQKREKTNYHYPPPLCSGVTVFAKTLTLWEK